MITSISNDLIKLVRSLHHKKGRNEENLFLAEGIHLVEEALKSGANIKHFFWSDKLVKNGEGKALFAKLAAKYQGFEVTEAILAKICETENPQGIIATVVIPPQTDLEPAGFQLGLIIDGLQDPGNVGAIIRTAWSAGCDGLLFTLNSADPFQGKVVRASQGGLFYQRIFRHLEPAFIAKWATQNNIQIIAGDLKASQFCYQIDLRRPSMILIGNEGRGINPEWLDYNVTRTLIPQPGGAESLNASVSAGILLYEAVRQRLTGN